MDNHIDLKAQLGPKPPHKPSSDLPMGGLSHAHPPNPFANDKKYIGQLVALDEEMVKLKDNSVNAVSRGTDGPVRIYDIVATTGMGEQEKRVHRSAFIFDQLTMQVFATLLTLAQHNHMSGKLVFGTNGVLAKNYR